MSLGLASGIIGFLNATRKIDKIRDQSVSESPIVYFKIHRPSYYGLCGKKWCYFKQPRFRLGFTKAGVGGVIETHTIHLPPGAIEVSKEEYQKAKGSD